MRFDILKTIYLKEMLDQLRDRRALISMVLVPLVAIPALVVAAAVGTTTIGCGDDTTTMTTPPDLAMKAPDLYKPPTPPDMVQVGD